MSKGKWAKTRLSKKQRQILETLCVGNRDESGATVSWLDLDQLVERVPYEVKKPAMNFSVRYLADKGMLTKGQKEIRRSKKRSVIIPTQLAFGLVSKPKPMGYFEDDGIIETF